MQRSENEGGMDSGTSHDLRSKDQKQGAPTSEGWGKQMSYHKHKEQIYAPSFLFYSSRWKLDDHNISEEDLYSPLT